MVGPALDDNRYIDYPYNDCECHRKLVFFPDGDADRPIERLVWERWPWLGIMEGDVHANSNQEGSADKAHVGNSLENTAKVLPLED
jgi:hypothetical protein